MKKTILFDAVGTLIYPEPSVGKAYQQIAQVHGRSLELEEIETQFQKSYASHFIGDGQQQTSESTERHLWQTLVAEVFAPGPVSEPMFQDLWDHFAQPANWTVFPHVQQMLTQLGDHQLSLCIASNFDARLHGIVQAKPELAAINQIFVSTEIGFRKPSAQFFEAILSTLQLAPKQCLMIGDDPINDISGAGKLGISSLQVGKDRGNFTELAQQIIAWTDQQD